MMNILRILEPKRHYCNFLKFEFRSKKTRWQLFNLNRKSERV